LRILALSLLAVAMTVPFAVASWQAVEKHALKLKSMGFKRATEEPVPLLS
jgi:peptidoglycan/LPS O-acetylase OafA/YrhL